MTDLARMRMCGGYATAPRAASRAGVGSVCGALALAACGSGRQAAPAEPVAPPEAVPESVSVPGARVEVGLARGRTRWWAEVPALRVGKRPVTRAEYGACVAAGVCAAPAAGGEECGSGEAGAVAREGAAARAPELCATAVQAARFCRWVGGALPTVEQWLLAARGPAVRRYAWGDTPPTCEQHPLGVDCGSATGAAPGAERVEVQALARPTGEHAAGAAPSGVEDVMLVRRERVVAADGSRFGSCRGAGGCLVTGWEAGSIDAVEVGATEPLEQVPAMFRCVSEVAP